MLSQGTQWVVAIVEVNDTQLRLQPAAGQNSEAIQELVKRKAHVYTHMCMCVHVCVCILGL